MLVKFTIESGLVQITTQARAAEFRQFLNDLDDYNPDAQPAARASIQRYLNTHREFTAARIACISGSDDWLPEFAPLYLAVERVVDDRLTAQQTAYQEARKFLGLLVWSEALQHSEQWHFTKYPKRPLAEEDANSFTAEDCWVCHYFAVDSYIRANVKLRQAENFRSHGDERRASELENAARLLQQHWRRTQ